MIFTEEEALTKWCSLARVPMGFKASHADGKQIDGKLLSASVNRTSNGEPHPACLCLASDCMHWGWYGVRPTPGRGPESDAPVGSCTLGGRT
jgi:hypothetical protein